MKLGALARENASDADLFSRCTLVDGYRSIVVDGADRIRPTRNRMKLGPKLFWTAKHDLITGVIKCSSRLLFSRALSVRIASKRRFER